MIRVQLGTALGGHRIVFRFCEPGELLFFDRGFSRHDTSGLPLLGSALGTLRGIVGLPDALAAHPRECGHPDMCRLADGVFHCPECCSEVLPIEGKAVAFITTLHDPSGY